MNTLVSRCFKIRFSWAVALVAMAALALSASTASANTAPGAPVGLVVAPGNGKLVAGWNAPEGGAAVTSYTVQYKASTAADWVTASHSGTVTDTEITGLTNATAYDVRVRASNGAGYGQWSDTASANPHQDVVWSAVLTVDDHVNGQFWGCSIHPVDESGDWLTPCSKAMTEDEFTHEGGTLAFTEFVYIADWDYYNVVMAPSVPNNSGLLRGELHVGDDTYALDDTSIVEWYENNTGFNIDLPQAVSWSKGQKVALSLGGGPPKVEPTPVAQDQVVSSDATLSALSVSDGSNDVPLTPAFAADTAGYTASVPNSVGSVTVTPTVNDPNATVTVAGSIVTSGTASSAIALTAGVAETIDVVVTAQNKTSKTYTVTVTRQKSSDSTLKALTVSDGTNDVPLTPDFAPDTAGYTASVDNSVGSVTVTPTVSDENATVTVAGSAVTSGTASSAIALTAGAAEIIDVVVTAQNDTTKTYTVAVTREKSSDATLSALTVSDGTNDVPLTPDFAPDDADYTAGVPNSVSSVTVTPTVNDPNATVTVGGAAVASGSPSSAIALTAGAAEIIDILVTAQNGITNSYTVTVAREAAAQSAQIQDSGDSEIIERCRIRTGGVEGLRVCVTPFEGTDAILLLTLPAPAPANGTTVTLATSPTQEASSDDFTMPSSITIPEGERSAIIIVATIADDEDEDDESIHIYACTTPGCDPLEDWDYNHGIVIPGTRVPGGL